VICSLKKACLPFLLVLPVLAIAGTMAPALADVLVAAKPAPVNKIEVWELLQTSELIGPIRCLMCPSGVRLNAEKMGIVWVFKAPQWDAYLYNMESKAFCSFTYDQWKERGFFMPAARGKNGERLDRFKGMKVKKTGQSLDIAGCKSYGVTINLPSGSKYGDIWLASGITAPAQFSEVIGKMVQIPIEKGGTPLRARIFERSGHAALVLDTLGASKKRVSASLFDPLKGFRRVKDEMALLLDSGDSESSSLFASPPPSRKHGKQH